MRKYLYIMFGGMLGAMLRAAIKNIPNSVGEWPFLFGTMFVNTTGCLLLALVLGAASGFFELDKSLRIGITAGFLGAFTTFSAVCRETADLMTAGKYTAAFLYIILSAFLGLAAIYMGDSIISKVLKFRSKAGDEAADESGVE